MASLVLSPISPFPASYVTDHPTRVLVTGAGTPAALAFMQSAADTDVELWASDSNRYAAGLFLVPSARRVLLPPAKSPEFAERLLIVSQALAIDVIVPMLDDELLPIASIRSRLAAARIGVLTSPGHVVASCLDQWLLVQTCLRHGVPVPRTKLLDRPMALRGFARPFTIRRRLRAGWGDSTVVGEHSLAPTVPLDGSHILQEYLTGEEYSIDVLAYSNGHVAAVVPLVPSDAFGHRRRRLHARRPRARGPRPAHRSCAPAQIGREHPGSPRPSRDRTGDRGLPALSERHAAHHRQRRRHAGPRASRRPRQHGPP